MQNILEKIKSETTSAMRARDQVRVLTLRGASAAFTNELVALKRKPTEELTDPEALSVIRRLVKQRKDSIEQFDKGGRADLADNERAELKVLEEFLPAAMPEEDIRKIVKEKMEKLEIKDKSKAGQLMGAVMKEAGGNADSATVKKIVEEVLQ